MEIKRNEATINRPEGDRVLDAPYVYIDIPDYIDQLKDEKQWKDTDRNAITVYKSDQLTIVVCALREDAEIINKAVDEIITIQVLKGEVRITTPDGDFDGEKRQMIVVRPGVEHTVKAEAKSYLLLTTYKC